MKEKRFKQGILFLALAMLLLIPASFSLAKYTETADVGTVTLNITVDPPVLDQNWKNALTTQPTKLVLDSFDAQSGNLSGVTWDSGTPIGAKDTESNFTNGVRLFNSGSTAYILAKGFGTVVFPADSASLFKELSGIQQIQFNKVNTEHVASMNQMFKDCTALTTLGLGSSFVTSDVTGMIGMFHGCKKLETLDLGSQFSTSRVASMRYMFANCGSLTTLNLGSKFDTSKVNDMERMFGGCSSLTSLDVSGFNTSQVTKMSQMFYSCSSLTSLDVSRFNTSRVTDMSMMFNSCSSLTSLDVSSFNTSQVTNMSIMFQFCESLGTLTLGDKFDTSRVTNMQEMFHCCKALTTLDLSSFDTSLVTTMNGMFHGCEALRTLDLGDEFNTSQVANMRFMFADCNNLQSLDLSSFDTSNVTDMENMFGTCDKLEQITLGLKFQFFGNNGYLPAQSSTNITGADGKWYIDSGEGFVPADVATHQANVTEATTYYAVPAVLDPGWRTTVMWSLTNETTLVLDSYNAQIDNLGVGVTWDSGTPIGQKVNNKFTDTVKLFVDGTTAYILARENSSVVFPQNSEMLFFISQRDQFETIQFNKINTSKVTNMSDMFSNWSSLTSLDLSKFDTSKVTNMGSMFSGCMALTSLNLSPFDTSNVTDMNSMFSGCGALTSLDLSPFNTSNVTSMAGMFRSCFALTELKLSSFDTSKVTDMGSMFAGCQALTPLDLSRFNTEKVTNMGSMFLSCQALTTLNFGNNFNTSNVTNMYSMFTDCQALTSLALSDFDTANVTNMAYMFKGCSSLTPLNLSSFNTSKVTDMDSMFSGCQALTTLNFGNNFNTSSVTNMYSMFTDCQALTSLALSDFDTRYAAVNYNTDQMFNSCDKLKKITLSAAFRFALDGSGNLHEQTAEKIPGADGKWYIDSNTGYMPGEVAAYHKTVSDTTTYFAVKEEAPAASASAVSAFSLTPEMDTDPVTGQNAGVGVGRSRPYFVGSNEPLFVGKLGANRWSFRLPTTQIGKLFILAAPAQRPSTAERESLLSNNA